MKTLLNHFISISPFFLLALTIRITLATQNISYLDRLFLPDDTYYILAIARNIFFNQLLSIDGHISTNGFQPLIVFLQVPILFLTSNPDVIIKFSVFLSAITGASSTILLGLLLKETYSQSASQIAMVLYAISPAILLNDLNGLETSLSGFTCLLLLLLLHTTITRPSFIKTIALGLCCSLVLLARIDNAFLVLLSGIALITSIGFRRTCYVVVSALIGISPWWIYLYCNFGHILPESGKALKQLSELSPYHHLSALISVYKITDVFAIPSLSLIPGLIIRAGVLGILTYCIMKLKDIKLPIVLKIACYSTLPILLFYSCYLPAYWFFERYYNWVYIVIIMIIACTLSSAASQRTRYTITGVLIIVAIPGLLFFLSKPAVTPLLDFYGPKGFREPALRVLSHIPAGSRVVSLQSGALNYYAPGDIQVTNIDGVVNHKAYIAIKKGQLFNYLKQIDADYFTGWQLNRDLLSQVTDERMSPSCMALCYKTSHSPRPTFLYRLNDCF